MVSAIESYKVDNQGTITGITSMGNIWNKSWNDGKLGAYIGRLSVVHSVNFEPSQAGVIDIGHYSGFTNLKSIDVISNSDCDNNDPSHHYSSSAQSPNDVTVAIQLSSGNYYCQDI